MTTAPVPSTGTPPPYFIDFKKGEVNELKQLLRNTSAKDVTKKRELVKKVIALMTQGIDMSKCFSEMIMSAHTADLVQKKLIYLYISEYAEKNPEIALLSVNTLQRDAADQDPMVRGLALRTMCSLRIPNLTEYVTTPLTKGLCDGNAYVRKAAILGTMKIYAITPDLITQGSYIGTIQSLLNDPNGQVVVNALYALGEFTDSPLTREVLLALLNRLKTFDEWSQIQVLNALEAFVPKDQSEIFAIMNLLDDHFKHSNSALVLSVASLFLKITQDMPEIYVQVLHRLKSPLLTLMSSRCRETNHVVLCHLKRIALREPSLFSQRLCTVLLIL